MVDFKAEAEKVRNDINRELDKADSGSSSSSNSGIMPNKDGVTGAVTTVTGTVSNDLSSSSAFQLCERYVMAAQPLKETAKDEGIRANKSSTNTCGRRSSCYLHPYHNQFLERLRQ